MMACFASEAKDDGLEEARQKVVDACKAMHMTPMPTNIANPCVAVVKSIYEAAWPGTVGNKVAARCDMFGIQPNSGTWKCEDWRSHVSVIKPGDLACWESSSWFYTTDGTADFDLYTVSNSSESGSAWLKCTLLEYDNLNRQHRHARKTGMLSLEVTIADKFYTGCFAESHRDPANHTFTVVLKGEDGSELFAKRAGWTGHVGVVAENIDGNLKMIHWRGRADFLEIEGLEDANFRYKGGLLGYTSLKDVVGDCLAEGCVVEASSV